MFFDPEELKQKLAPLISQAGREVGSAIKQLGRNQTRMLAMQALIMQADAMTMDPEEIARKAEQIARAMEVYDA